MFEFRSLSESSLEELLQSEQVFVIFKHSNRCSLSAVALNRFKSVIPEIDSEAPVYLIDVIGERALSNEVANRTGVRHESPQVLVLQGTQVLYHDSHLSISNQGISSAIYN